jgi:hypothetical protein
VVIIFRWLRKRREVARRVSADADALIEEFGPRAYYEARDRARERVPRDPHWDLVRREIGERMNRKFVDTATRYLQD